MLSAWTLIGCFLFFLECYHVVGHMLVVLRIRLLPRKDLVRQRFYFLFDTATVFCTSILYTGILKWLAILQMCQHLFFYFTWNTHPYTIRVIDWSSLDYTRSDKKNNWDLDLFAGTYFDIIVHALNAFLLAQTLSSVQVFFIMAVVQAASYAVLYNPRFAWTDVQNIPKWVEKRISSIEN